MGAPLVDSNQVYNNLVWVRFRTISYFCLLLYSLVSRFSLKPEDIATVTLFTIAAHMRLFKNVLKAKNMPKKTSPNLSKTSPNFTKTPQILPKFCQKKQIPPQI